LAIVGWVGQAFFTSTEPGKNLFSAFWETTASWELAALPLFIWMGEILYRTRLSEQMFDGLSPWLSKVPGRLMHTTVLGCGIFGSVSGSSAATCATIAKVALPELERRGYDRDLAMGSLAAAGGLGILIPPSITMVVYAVAADASVVRLFLAGFLPGFLLMGLFSGYIMWWSLRNLHRKDSPLGQLDSLQFADRVHRLGAGGGYRHGHGVRRLWRAGFAGDCGRRKKPDQGKLLARAGGCHAGELHDYVHSGGRFILDQNHGFYRNSPRAG
jgi:tripartite ATP-independent transporter DctM subunit